MKWCLLAHKNRDTGPINVEINVMNKLRQHTISTGLKVQEVDAVTAGLASQRHMAA